MSKNVVANQIVVAGHICLDVIPSIQPQGNIHNLSDIFVPGKLIDIGAINLSTGGAVSNTGLALHRLGENVKLMGKIGDDLFGTAILQILKSYDESLSKGMIVAENENSSYTIVISPPGVDRIFLHCTGANDSFTENDVSEEALQEARIFHFGYPPLMRKMYEHEGQYLAQLLARVKQKGITISLDMARPDPDSVAGRLDWIVIFKKTLSYVDVFLPSFEEILYMLRPELYHEMLQQYRTDELLNCSKTELLSSLADELLAFGVAVVGIKLGHNGFYVKTTASDSRLQQMGYCSPPNEVHATWLNREVLAPCYAVEVLGTTGAGDCTIAGFLAGLSKGISLEETLLSAVGVGACNVEKYDAVSGIPHWNTVQKRIQSNWEQRNPSISLDGFLYDTNQKLWIKK